MEAEPLQYYTLSAWLKAEGAGGTNSPAVRVVELDSSRKWLTQTNLIFGKGTYDWTEKKLTFRTGINTSYLYVYANIWDGYGTFWLDDVELSPFFGPTIYLNDALTQNPDGTVTQRAKANDNDFTFYYIPRDRYIELQGEIQDMRGEDRALAGGMIENDKKNLNLLKLFKSLLCIYDLNEHPYDLYRGYEEIPAPMTG